MEISEMEISEMKQKVNALHGQELAQQEIDRDCFKAIQQLIGRLKSKRPGDRSGRDRIYSIAITDLEKVAGFFKLYNDMESFN